jgi:hypothetical protein
VTDVTPHGAQTTRSPRRCIARWQRLAQERVSTNDPVVGGGNGPHGRRPCGLPRVPASAAAGPRDDGARNRAGLLAARQHRAPAGAGDGRTGPMVAVAAGRGPGRRGRARAHCDQWVPGVSGRRGKRWPSSPAEAVAVEAAGGWELGLADPTVRGVAWPCPETSITSPNDFGHRVLELTRKGGKRSTEALAPATARALVAYIGGRTTRLTFLDRTRLGAWYADWRRYRHRGRVTAGWGQVRWVRDCGPSLRPQRSTGTGRSLRRHGRMRWGS